ncbi:MAG: type I glyceraldehyde-3-phosphate dehydrogenase [Sandaracinaceae bacterium]|nr:type I glyceraldehyde-3-phosphate dehydrogenase [Sandaracinaceae bacterium]MBK7150371.1 type I glyceraldehyde-3-phosphate dehydrogenase [Sandaracinaceae bacterium]MBK7777290.1 type I glyceraldehyde-3-phosphate dehydrogenase [Sandaracinaceae bacterium]
MPIKIGINGFGRIGRAVARMLLDDGNTGDVQLAAINDLTDPPSLAHLLQFDTVHRTYGHKVTSSDKAIIVDGQAIPTFSLRDPAQLPWKDLGVDVVLECTGIFNTRELAAKHLEAGAKKVIVSAPCKGADGTFCVGINDDAYDAKLHTIISNASCTTNCLAPMAKVVDDAFGILKGHVVTVHSYTNDQRILDLPHKKDYRRARAAAENIIPTSTGAASAIGLVLPKLAGKLVGSAVRVPTPNVSLTILTAHVSRATTVEEVNAAFDAAVAGPLGRILSIEPRPLVSSDFIGNPYSATLDVELTTVAGGDQVQVTAWYDNEWGFSTRMIDLVRTVSGTAN